MYSSSLKSDGAIVGLVADEKNRIDMSSNELNGEEAFENTQANESLVFIENDVNGELVEGIAIASLDEDTGEVIWNRSNDVDAVNQRTMSMSQMASMLKDKDRNNVYENAINESIQYFIKHMGYKPTVLDIGSGTGLLSCMAARHGAKKVHGFEMFKSLAKVADSVIQLNQYEDIINIQPCKSAEASFENEDDYADLLVSELLDSALIGESCLFSHIDAIQRLMHPADSKRYSLNSSNSRDDINSSINININRSDAKSGSVNNVINDSEVAYPQQQQQQQQQHLLFKLAIEDRIMPHSGDVTACFVQGDIIRDSIDISHVGMKGCNIYRENFDDTCSADTQNHDNDNNTEVNDNDYSNNSSSSSSSAHCKGGQRLLPVHWSRLERKGCKMISSPCEVLHIDFFKDIDSDENSNNDTSNNNHMNVDGQSSDVNNHDNETKTKCVKTDILVTQDGFIDGVLIWWKVYLLSPTIDPTRQYYYSTEPLSSNHNSSKNIDSSNSNGTVSSGDNVNTTTVTTNSTHHTNNPTNSTHRINNPSSLSSSAMNWQDHWLQCIYPLPKRIHCKKGDIFRLAVLHDIIQVWMNVDPTAISTVGQSPLVPATDESILDVQNNNKRIRVDNTLSASLELSKSESNNDNFNTATRPNKINTISKDMYVSPSPESCVCGWHMLCGSERLQMLNDIIRKQQWERAIQNMVEAIGNNIMTATANGNNSNNNNIENNNSDDNLVNKASIVYELDENAVPIILDLSDGSLLSLYTSYLLSTATNDNTPSSTTTTSTDATKSTNNNTILKGMKAVKVISKESKMFSRLFHSQLSAINNITGEEDILSFWDGKEDWSDLIDYICSGDDNSDNNDSVDGNENDSRTTAEFENNSALVKTKQSKYPLIVGLQCECYFYQLSSLPTWSALSFYYMRHSLQQLLHPLAVISPYKAVVKICAIEMVDLYTASHGLVDKVNGFDHTPFDTTQQDWHTHIYPYKLAHYRKRYLSAPTTVITLDYSSHNHGVICHNGVNSDNTNNSKSGNHENGSNTSSSSSDNKTKSSSPTKNTNMAPLQIPITKTGNCHGVAIWTDLCLDGNGSNNNSSTDSSNDIIHLNPIYASKRGYNNSKNLTNISSSYDDDDSNYEMDFPWYHTCNVKFFPTPISVSVSPTTTINATRPSTNATVNTDTSESLSSSSSSTPSSSKSTATTLLCTSSFTFSDSDFTFDFQIV